MASTGTRADKVYARLRSDTLSGKWHPGQRLPFDELCAFYDTSVGVLREALQRLAEQGLVQAEPHRGFRVYPASEEDLRWLTDARAEIESLTIRRSVEEGDLDWESRVLAAHHRLERTPFNDPDNASETNESWVAAHRDFHEALLDGCENKRLLGIASALRDSFELYRYWSLRVGRRLNRDVAAEHKKLLDLVMERDGAGAATAIREHINLTKSVWLEMKALDVDDHGATSG